MWAELLSSAASAYGGGGNDGGGGGGGGVGFSFSQSGSADSGPLSGDFGSKFGGIQTGGGLDSMTIAIIAAAAVAVLWLLKK